MKTAADFQNAITASQRRVWQLYANPRGSAYAPAHLFPRPKPLEALPRRVQDRACRMVLETDEMVPNECYLNVVKALAHAGTLRGIEYAEGLVWTEGEATPVGHAWLVIEGHLVDVSALGSGPEYPPRGVDYYGLTFPPDDILHTALEAEYLEPLGVTRAPPPPPGSVTCPACGGERTTTTGPNVHVLCTACNGDGTVVAQ